MIAPLKVSGQAAASVDAVPTYEVVPSTDLPRIDLTRSVGGEIIALFQRVCWSRRVVNATAPAPSRTVQLLQESGPIERVNHARIFMGSFLSGSLLAAVACVVPRAVGRYLAVVGLLLTLPASLASLAFLRLDMVKLLLTTYDFWFYTFTTTAGAVLIACSFGDARACVALVVWLGNLHTILIDANTRLICYLVLGSMATIALHLTVILAIETDAVDAWQALSFKFRQRRAGHVMYNNIISNFLTTMAVILVRNMYRRRVELREQAKIGCAMLRCLNYRCRVKIQIADSERLAQLASLPASQRVYLPPTCVSTFPLSQMHYVRYQGILDASQTIFPVQLDPLHWKSSQRAAFVALEVVALATTACVFATYPSSTSQPLAVLGLCCTMLFVGISIGLFHSAGSRCILFSFDYIFVCLQLSFGLLCASTLFNWDVRSIALASTWLGLHWVFSIDGLTPLMKEKIGVNIKLLLVPVLLLFVAAELAIAAELIWVDHWGLEDRVLVSLAGRVSLRLLPFFVSRLIMSFLWSLRLLWRILTSHDNDAVVQLGRVAYASFDPMVLSKPKVREAVMPGATGPPPLFQNGSN